MTGTSILQVERETLLANDLFLLADELEHVQAKRASSPQSSRSTSLESCEMLDFLRDQDETHPSETYFQSAIDK